MCHTSLPTGLSPPSLQTSRSIEQFALESSASPNANLGGTHASGTLIHLSTSLEQSTVGGLLSHLFCGTFGTVPPQSAVVNSSTTSNGMWLGWLLKLQVQKVLSFSSHPITGLTSGFSNCFFHKSSKEYSNAQGFSLEDAALHPTSLSSPGNCLSLCGSGPVGVLPFFPLAPLQCPV